MSLGGMKMVKKIDCCYGISSLVPNDGKHIFMIDYDHVSFYSIVEDLHRIQAVYGLSDIYVIESTNGYNALSFDKLPLKLNYEIGIQSILTDRDFVLYGFDRGYYTLRFDKDKKLERVLPTTFNKFPKSNAHREFMEWFFKKDIKKDSLFDDNKKLDIIQYPSDKNGYHVQKIRSCMELVKNNNVNE